jgi:hypothetical protein
MRFSACWRIAAKRNELPRIHRVLPKQYFPECGRWILYSPEPDIQIRLKLLQAAVECFAKRGRVEFLLDGLVEPFTDPVRLGPGMSISSTVRVELVLVVLAVAAKLRAAVRQNVQ